MSDFKLGDPIQVLRFGEWCDRVFLAAVGDTVYYRRSEGINPYAADATAVRAPQAKPLAVGDFARVDGFTVVEIVAGPFAGVSEWFAVKGVNGQVRPCPATDLTREDSPAQNYTDLRGRVYRADRGYRDSDGAVWRFTGKRNPEGIPYMTMFGNPDNRDTLTDIARVCGLLVEVP